MSPVVAGTGGGPAILSSRLVTPTNSVSTSGESNDLRHLLSAHLPRTGDRMVVSLVSVGCADFGRTAGPPHDLGKYSATVQCRWRDEPRTDRFGRRDGIAAERVARSRAFPLKKPEPMVDSVYARGGGNW